MPTRRSPFAYDSSGSEGAGTGSPMAMPMTGTGTGAANTTPFDQQLQEHMPGMMPMESPATLRRRLMPMAGPMPTEPDMVQAVQAMLRQRQGGG